MPEEELDFLFPRSPFLKMIIHHVLKGNRSLYRDREVTEKYSLVITASMEMKFIII